MMAWLAIVSQYIGMGTIAFQHKGVAMAFVPAQRHDGICVCFGFIPEDHQHEEGMAVSPAQRHGRQSFRCFTSLWKVSSTNIWQIMKRTMWDEHICTIHINNNFKTWTTIDWRDQAHIGAFSQPKQLRSGAT